MEAATNLQGIQYLTFTLAEELFAVDIGKVSEVLEFAGVTKLPRMPNFMRGVINIRGNVVPVLDLKQKFATAPLSGWPVPCGGTRASGVQHFAAARIRWRMGSPRTRRLSAVAVCRLNLKNMWYLQNGNPLAPKVFFQFYRTNLTCSLW